MPDDAREEAEERQAAIEQQQASAFSQQQAALNEQLAKIEARELELAPTREAQDEANLLTAQENLKFARGEGDIGKETERGFGTIVKDTRELLRRAGLKPGDTAYDTTINNLLTGIEAQRDEIRFGRRDELAALSASGQDLSRRNTLSFLDSRNTIENQLASSALNRSGTLTGNLQNRARISRQFPTVGGQVARVGGSLAGKGAVRGISNFVQSPFLRSRTGGKASSQSFLSAFLGNKPNLN